MDINYGLICEDIAHKTFLEIFLKNQNDFNFILNMSFYKRFRANNKKEVVKSLPLISYNAFEEYFLNLIFVGIDYDDLDRTNFDKELESLYSKINGFKDKAIIFYPVQSIEHWFWYLKIKKENPNFTKNINLENKDRKTAKKEVYNNKRTNVNVIIQIMKDADFKWLRNHSLSFNYFYNSLLKYLKKQ